MGGGCNDSKVESWWIVLRSRQLQYTSGYNNFALNFAVSKIFQQFHQFKKFYQLRLSFNTQLKNVFLLVFF